MIRSAFGFLCASAALAADPTYAEEPSHRTITVTGEATVRYYPDAARIQFRLRNSELTWDEARQANQKIVKLVDEKLSALKVKDLKITFGPASASQVTVRRGGAFGGAPGGGGPAMAERMVGSTRLVTLLVREADLDKLSETIGKIEKTVIDAGVVTGQSVIDDDGFRTTANAFVVTLMRRDDSEFRDEALTKAVQSAAQKAKALARGAGVQIKEMVSIVENDDTSSRPVRTGPVSARSTAAPTLTVGELEVTVRVTVKYSY
jgi:uncharacterized protein YggE